MADRLRELIDLVLASLDERDADGRALAARASFSRDHLDRLLAAATGESPVALRRRLLLERAAWQLRDGVPAGEAAAGAGYGSTAAFSRAFGRAYGMPPRTFAAASSPPIALPAPNGIRFHPPAGLLIPRAGGATRRARSPADRMLAHHLERARELLHAAAALPAEALARPLRPGLVVVWFDGEEASAALMAARLVAMLEAWTAAIAGEPSPFDGDGPPDAPPAPLAELLDRFEPAARRLARLVAAIERRGAWDDAFVDALCDPPQSFTYGGVVAHILTYGAIRREALAGVLADLGVDGLASADPLMWEQVRRGA